MHRVSVKLEKHHSEGKIHGNIHPKNILMTSELDAIHFMDSLKGKNKNSCYSSLENQKHIYGQWIDIFSLGIIFLELLSGNTLEETSQFGPFILPFKNIIFPEEKHLSKIKNHSLRFLIQHMLDPNYK